MWPKKQKNNSHEECGWRVLWLHSPENADPSQEQTIWTFYWRRQPEFMTKKKTETIASSSRAEGSNGTC
jgi:hypothetical protein